MEPGRKALGPAGSERVSRVSFLPASLESLLGGAGTAVCYPTLEKRLQGEGEPLKAFLLIIQQLELPAAPVGAGRQALARAPRLGLAGLGEGLAPGQAGSLVPLLPPRSSALQSGSVEGTRRGWPSS